MKNKTIVISEKTQNGLINELIKCNEVVKKINEGADVSEESSGVIMFIIAFFEGETELKMILRDIGYSEKRKAWIAELTLTTESIGQSLVVGDHF